MGRSDPSDGVGPRPCPLTSRLPAAGSGWVRLVEFGILFGLVAVAILLRFYDLDRFGIRGDEAIYSGQAATLAGDPERARFFAVFRAHPLIFQAVLAVLYGVGLPDMASRWLVAASGVAAVLVAWGLGRSVGTRVVGLSAAAIVALVPYAVSMSRMALLDTTTGVLLGLGVLGAVRFLDGRRLAWLVASAGFTALACLTKEIAVVALGGFLVSQLDPKLRIGWRAFAAWTGTFVIVAAAYPLSLLVGGGLRSAYLYLRWQLLSRGANPADTYLTFIDPYLSWAVAAVFLVGVVACLVWPRRAQRLVVLVGLAVLAALQYWKLKEVQLPIIAFPILAAVAGVGFGRIGEGIAWLISRARVSTSASSSDRDVKWIRALAAGIVAIVLIVPLGLRSWQIITSVPDIAQSIQRGGYPGQLEAARWYGENAPEGAVCAVASPNLAALFQFYSGHDCVGMDVPATARRRNPADVFVDHAGTWITDNRIHYVITDLASSRLRSNATDELEQLVEDHHGRLVHEVHGQVREGDGEPFDTWLVRIYEVRP